MPRGGGGGGGAASSSSSSSSSSTSTSSSSSSSSSCCCCCSSSSSSSSSSNNSSSSNSSGSGGGGGSGSSRLLATTLMPTFTLTSTGRITTMHESMPDSQPRFPQPLLSFGCMQDMVMMSNFAHASYHGDLRLGIYLFGLFKPSGMCRFSKTEIVLLNQNAIVLDHQKEDLSFG